MSTTVASHPWSRPFYSPVLETYLDSATVKRHIEAAALANAETQKVISTVLGHLHLALLALPSSKRKLTLRQTVNDGQSVHRIESVALLTPGEQRDLVLLRVDGIALRPHELSHARLIQVFQAL